MSRSRKGGADGSGPLRLSGTAVRRADRPVEIVLFSHGQQEVGRLRFRVCPSCRAGRILDLWIDEAWRRRGLGREAVHGLLSLHPGHRWTTTPQSREGRAFFAAMSQEMPTCFPCGAPLCAHLRGWPRRLAHHVLGRWLGP